MSWKCSTHQAAVSFQCLLSFWSINAIISDTSIMVRHRFVQRKHWSYVQQMCGRGTYKQLFLSLNDQPTIGPIKKKDNNKKNKTKTKTKLVSFISKPFLLNKIQKIKPTFCNAIWNVTSYQNLKNKNHEGKKRKKINFKNMSLNTDSR